MIDLVADIGGTGSRLAIVKAGWVEGTHEYRNAEFANFDGIFSDFLQRTNLQPGRAALAVAGPVMDGCVHMTNLGWDLDASSLAGTFGLSAVSIVNDFEAMAWAIPQLTDADLHHSGGPLNRGAGNCVVVGAGTGLGVSALVSDGSHSIAVPGEGGHLGLGAGNALEAALVESAVAEFGRCSAERLVSGAGLSRIYRHISENSCTPEEIVNRAAAGEYLAREAFEVFSCLLASVAGDLALVFGARGGVYIGGGIVPANLRLFEQTGFRQRFEAKGRYRSYMDAIPCWVITARNPSFLGLQHLLANMGKAPG
jgi:glucokinase